MKKEMKRNILYFKDKEDIRNTLIILKSSQLLKKAVKEVKVINENEGFVERLINLADYLIDYLSYDRELLKFISKSLSWGLFMDSAKYESKSEDIIDLDMFIKELIHKNNVTLDNPELTIFTIIELVNSTVYSTVINREPTTIEEFKPFLFDEIRLITSAHIVKQM